MTSPLRWHASQHAATATAARVSELTKPAVHGLRAHRQCWAQMLAEDRPLLCASVCGQGKRVAWHVRLGAPHEAEAAPVDAGPEHWGRCVGRAFGAEL